VAMGGGEMKMVEVLHCLPFPLFLEHNKVDAPESGVGEKTCQQAKARQSHSNNHPVKHSKVCWSKKELLARVVLSLSTSTAVLCSSGEHTLFCWSIPGPT